MTVIHDTGGAAVIIGGGIAGLMTALHLAPEPVVLLTRAPLGREASSAWAQGGLAASVGPDDDPARHLADTLAAGDGLCDPQAAARITAAAPAAIDALVGFGARFDRDAEGRLTLGLEAAHGRRRIVHANGADTGPEIMRALVAAVHRTPSITVLEGLVARRLATADGAVTGVLAAGGAGPVLLATSRVVIATGGIGGLFQDTTNPLGCFGQGLAMAARAGAELIDLEFVQFHPTALDGPARPMPLLSEALRGEGAVLIDDAGRRFMADVPGAELAPRDVVARAVWHELARGRGVFLDARARLGPRVAAQFPAIHRLCLAAGVDPSRAPIPVRPAVHYHMGGIAVDGEGGSTLPGLWACGEAACTGLHGANRLASNSLIEGAVAAAWVAESLAGTPARRGTPALPAAGGPSDPAPIRPIVTQALGVIRDGDTLRAAAAALAPLAEASDAAAVALMMAVAALRREESCGAHFRTDAPCKIVPHRAPLRLDQAIAAAHDLTPLPLARSA